MPDEINVIQEGEVTNEPDAAEAKVTEVDWKAVAEKMQAEVKKLQGSLTRQGYELGELRQMRPLVDRLLTEQTTKKTEPVDYFTDPAKAVEQTVANSPEIQRLKNESESLRQQRMILQVKEAHPDYLDIVKDAKFIEWVEASKIRTRDFQAANHGYDFDAANELFTNWKERQTLANSSKTEQELKQKSETDLKAAKVHTGSGVSGKKVYSRLDIMKLKTSDPDAYLALDVQRLYAEGRVR